MENSLNEEGKKNFKKLYNSSVKLLQMFEDNDRIYNETTEKFCNNILKLQLECDEDGRYETLNIQTYKELFKKKYAWRTEVFWEDFLALMKHYENNTETFYKDASINKGRAEPTQADIDELNQLDFNPKHSEDFVTKIKEEHIAEMRTEIKAARAWQDSLHNAIKSVFTPQMIDLMDYPSNFFRDVSYITWIESIEQEQCFYSIINEMKENKQFIDPVKNPWDK